MNKAKIQHDRKIKKTEYKIGELVLTDHPELKKGLSSGIAHKYFGPFEIVGKNPNNVDYYIKKLGAKKCRTKQVHISRLKTFFYNKADFLEKCSEKTIKLESANKPSELNNTNKIKNKITKKSKKINSESASNSDITFKPQKLETVSKSTRKLRSKKIIRNNYSSESNTSDYETLAEIKNKLKKII
ncbi:unnamed protein product [Brachionus calyciflorus]|uniref:Uncharacterized protein n=1 Tax=Brachionus calyciflorus TaxID=104777 RepID=A0A814M8W8_9BILA|nr:unnamed protein product [Brachionus calyciflorus]